MPNTTTGTTDPLEAGDGGGDAGEEGGGGMPAPPVDARAVLSLAPADETAAPFSLAVVDEATVDLSRLPASACLPLGASGLERGVSGWEPGVSGLAPLSSALLTVDVGGFAVVTSTGLSELFFSAFADCDDLGVLSVMAMIVILEASRVRDGQMNSTADSIIIRCAVLDRVAGIHARCPEYSL